MISKPSPVWAPQPYRKNFLKPIDFFARRVHFIDHLAPIWNNISMAMRGTFYVPLNLEEYTQNLGIQEVRGLKSFGPSGNPIRVVPEGDGPLVTSAYGDLKMAYQSNPKRPYILMEHGVGLSFPERAPGYAGGTGSRQYVSLFLAPNQAVASKTAKTYPNAAQAIIGTPKMDKWAKMSRKKRDIPPTVCISFHWNGSRVCPEAGNAFEYYKDYITNLKKHFHVIGHGHPKIIDELASFYKKNDIETLYSFDDVLSKADCYVNDTSSTLYEFACTGRPVVFLNAPWFRKDKYWGIRWWDYTDIGPQCDEPGNLVDCIKQALGDKTHFITAKRKMVTELYPFLGTSSTIAAKAIMDFVKGFQKEEPSTC